MSRVPASAATLASLVQYLEEAHRHADAARAAERLQKFVAPIRGVFPSRAGADLDGAGAALSLGATLTPLHITVHLPATGTDTGGVTVTDTSYLPALPRSRRA